jgi:replicative DNA helicase
MRQTPRSPEAEAAVLGSVLLDPSCMDNLVIHADDFYENRNAVLWQSLVEMRGAGKYMDCISIAEWMKERRELDTVGGYDRLDELQHEAIVPGHAQSYAESVIETAKSRRLIETLDKGVNLAYDGDAAEVGSQVMSELVGALGANVDDLEIHEHIDQFIEACMEERAGNFNWWNTAWDYKMGRLDKDIVILHAPRSTGKTALMLQWITDCHIRGNRAPLASIEMLKEELAQRFVAHVGQVNTLRMRIRKPTDDEHQKAREARHRVAALNLSVRDKSMTIDDIKAWAAKEARAGASAFFIDNLLSISEGKRKYDSKTAMYDYFFRQFRDMRDMHKVPIVVLAHPNAEGGVAWSKDAENFADIIILLKNWEDGMRWRGKEIDYKVTEGQHIVAMVQKNRQGIQPMAHLDFIGETQTFKHLEWV